MRSSERAFNELWFRSAPKLQETEAHALSSFFHPLDGVRDWNRLYGKRGFVQYQFCVPEDQDETSSRPSPDSRPRAWRASSRS